MAYGIFKDDAFQDLNKFAPDLASHITFIKYEMITPDMSLLCFRTTAPDGSEHYFALLRFDYLNTIRYASKMIQKHFAKVIEYMQPFEKQKGHTQLEQKSAYDDDHCLRLLLARTERPKGNGYWASYIQIMPGDLIAEKLRGLSAEDETMARKTLAEIIGRSLPAGVKTDTNNFLSGWEQKVARVRIKPEDLTVNDTDLGINLFKNASGHWEAFHNYVKR